MIPALVVSAHEEWIFVPTKYRLSNTFAGSVYQVSRAGGGGGATSGPGAVCGATHTRTSVPVKSNAAAAFTRARYSSIGLAGGVCACAAPTPMPMTRPRRMTDCMLLALSLEFCPGRLGGLDDPGRDRQVAIDLGRERFRTCRERHVALLQHGLAHLIVGQCGKGRAVQAVDDRLRRADRRPQADEGRHGLEARQRIADIRNLSHARRNRPLIDRERPHAA